MIRHFLFYFFYDYSYDTPYPQHCTEKKNILKTFFRLKILQCSPYRKHAAMLLTRRVFSEWITRLSASTVLEQRPHSPGSQHRQGRPALAQEQLREELGWESRRHVGDMSPRQPNVVTFGQNAPVAPTQFWSRHIFFCRDLPTSTKISSLVPEVHTENSSVSSDMWVTVGVAER